MVLQSAASRKVEPSVNELEAAGHALEGGDRLAEVPIRGRRIDAEPELEREVERIAQVRKAPDVAELDACNARSEERRVGKECRL